MFGPLLFESEKRSTTVVDLNDQQNILETLAQPFSTAPVRPEIRDSILSAVKILEKYDKELDLTPQQINKIYRTLHINEATDPQQMNTLLRTNDHVAVLKRRYIDSYLTKTNFQAILKDLLSTLGHVVTNNVVQALVDLVKNISYICFTVEEFNTAYRDLCFKFFTSDPNSDDVLVLVLNIHYGDIAKHRGCSFFRCVDKRMRLNFFGALVKTDILQYPTPGSALVPSKEEEDSA